MTAMGSVEPDSVPDIPDIRDLFVETFPLYQSVSNGESLSARDRARVEKLHLAAECSLDASRSFVRVLGRVINEIGAGNTEMGNREIGLIGWLIEHLGEESEAIFRVYVDSTNILKMDDALKTDAPV